MSRSTFRGPRYVFGADEAQKVKEELTRLKTSPILSSRTFIKDYCRELRLKHHVFANRFHINLLIFDGYVW